MSAEASEYRLSEDAAWLLAALAVLPRDERRRLLASRTRRWIIDFTAELVGLANSLCDNNREMVELLLITEGGLHPNTAETANLPTLLGAAHGARLAEQIDQESLCGGCAVRLGTPANQSIVTTSDADWLAQPGQDRFLCHLELDEKGEPFKTCLGVAKLLAARRKDKAQAA